MIGSAGVITACAAQRAASAEEITELPPEAALLVLGFPAICVLVLLVGTLQSLRRPKR